MNKYSISVHARPVSVQHMYVYRAFGRGKLMKSVCKRALDLKELIRNAWIDKYGEECVLSGPVKETIIFNFKGGRNTDIDNNFKAVNDALNKLAYEDDGDIMQIEAYKQHNMEFDEIHIVVEPYIEPIFTELDIEYPYEDTIDEE